MKFEITIKKGNSNIEDIEKCLHRSIKMTRLSETADGILYECESLNTGGRPRRLTEDNITDIYNMYMSGEPVNSIAKKHKCTKAMVYKMTSSFSKEREQRLMAIVRLMKMNNATNVKIAQELSLSRPTITRLVQKIKDEDAKKEDSDGNGKTDI